MSGVTCSQLSPAMTTRPAIATSPPPHVTDADHHSRVRAVRAALHLSRTRGHTPEPYEGAAEAAFIAATSSAVEPVASNSDSDEVAPDAPTASVKPPWRRILYAPQPYPDSYVDHTFLSSLVTNANVRPLSYTSLCLGACTITQRLCLLSLWVATFHAMRTGTVRVQSVLAIDGGALALGTIAMGAMQAQESRVRHWITSAVTASLRLLLLTLVLLFVSPLLLTLTLAYSSDTIWALTAALAAVHVVAFDYRWVNEARTGKKDFRGALSLNAGIFAAILLGSRFQSDGSQAPAGAVALDASAPLQCFAFVLTSFIVFGGMSVLAVWARRCSDLMHAALTATIVGAAISVLALMSSPDVCSDPLPALLLPALMLVCGGVTFVAPAWLKWSQKYKNEIHGDWDYDDTTEMESDNL